MLLEQLNFHRNDDALSFDEMKHEYSYQGVPLKYSVTQLIENCFEKFDADAAIEKMMNSSRWPRPEYMNNYLKRPMTAAEIKRKWNSQGEYSRNLGTWLHFNIERYFNNLVRGGIELMLC